MSLTPFFFPLLFLNIRAEGFEDHERPKTVMDSRGGPGHSGPGSDPTAEWFACHNIDPDSDKAHVEALKVDSAGPSRSPHTGDPPRPVTSVPLARSSLRSRGWQLFKRIRSRHQVSSPQGFICLLCHHCGYGS
eukprot:661267-Hanusia_phi.AAC.8